MCCREKTKSNHINVPLFVLVKKLVAFERSISADREGQGNGDRE